MFDRLVRRKADRHRLAGSTKLQSVNGGFDDVADKGEQQIEEEQALVFTQFSNGFDVTVAPG